MKLTLVILAALVFALPTVAAEPVQDEGPGVPAVPTKMVAGDPIDGNNSPVNYAVAGDPEDGNDMPSAVAGDPVDGNDGPHFLLVYLPYPSGTVMAVALPWRLR